MVDIGIFNSHWVYILAIWHILWLFVIFFPRFGTLHQEKSGNPALIGDRRPND
jgi:hypothetical protein